MFTAARWVLAASVVLASGLALAVGGDDSRANPAARPLNRDNARHRQLLKCVVRGGGDVVFLGDSITERWESTGAKVWRETFAPLKAVNLGVGGDQTGHVLWRIREGKELDLLPCPNRHRVCAGAGNRNGRSTRCHSDDWASVVTGLVSWEIKRE